MKYFRLIIYTEMGYSKTGYINRENATCSKSIPQFTSILCCIKTSNLRNRMTKYFSSIRHGCEARMHTESTPINYIQNEFYDLFYYFYPIELNNLRFSSLSQEPCYTTCTKTNKQTNKRLQNSLHKLNS